MQWYAQSPRHDQRNARKMAARGGESGVHCFETHCSTHDWNAGRRSPDEAATIGIIRTRPSTMPSTRLGEVGEEYGEARREAVVKSGARADVVGEDGRGDRRLGSSS